METTMTRLTVVNPDHAVGPAKTLLGAVEKKLGLVPNMTRAMAANAAVLDGYLALAEALSRGKLGARLGAAALAFARRVVDTRGHVSDDDIAAVRAAGYDDAAIGELVALVALNTFTNYFNSVAATEVDFPRVAARLRQAA
jgi:hypothetical protein